MGLFDVHAHLTHPRLPALAWVRQDVGEAFAVGEIGLDGHYAAEL